MKRKTCTTCGRPLNKRGLCPTERTPAEQARLYIKALRAKW
jgi:hypothetical protein